MKKRFIILLITIAALLLVSGFLYLRTLFKPVSVNDAIGVPEDAAGDAADSAIYDFDLKERPWLARLDTKINTTYEALMDNGDYIKSLRCTGEPEETGKNPYAPVEAVCLKGNGAKMVIPSPHYFVFDSPKEGGLFEQKHRMSTISFFDGGKSNTKFFVIPFDDYEVPTSYPVEASAYLPVWKDIFLRSNGMSEDYFNSHIFVVGFFVFDDNYQGSASKEIVVSYYFQLDWVYARLSDTLNVEVGDAKDQPDADITKIKPIDHLASQERIKEAVKAASPALGFSASHDLIFEKSGNFSMRLHGTISEKNNECIFGTIDLENAKVSEIRNSACRIQ
jgi:hypothetical protein